MTVPSPLRQHLLDLGAALAVYGPPELGVELPEIVGDEIDLEYAALRKGCLLIDRPDRGTIQLKGPERLAFLNNMITQELKDMPQFGGLRSFWLNRKGRIDADLRVTNLDDLTFLDLDVHAVQRTLEGLQSFLIMEDAELTDETPSHHRLSLIGPTAGAMLDSIGGPLFGSSPTEMPDGAAGMLVVGDQTVMVDRHDTAGVPGFELLVHRAGAVELWDRLMTARFDSEQAQAGELSPLASKIRLRPGGWHAYNVARIEAGTPLFNLDFTTESLPAETGVLEDRVSFTKGCYLGQEVVARMHSLGHPKQTLVALRLAGDAAREADGQPRQPLTGAPLRKTDQDKVIGAITSSVVSPMLGATAIAFAIVKWGAHEPGTKLLVPAEGVEVEAEVQPQLRFLSD
ncbi:MAG: glycine cleavage T C-terminal barrel domain-containing protein [Planctomycetota bacterium]